MRLVFCVSDGCMCWLLHVIEALFYVVFNRTRSKSWLKRCRRPTLTLSGFHVIILVVASKLESRFGLCFWLELAAKWLESRLKSNLTILHRDFMTKSATLYAHYATILQPCCPSDSANHKFNLICHAVHDTSFFFQKGLVKTALLHMRYIYISTTDSASTMQ